MPVLSTGVSAEVRFDRNFIKRVEREMEGAMERATERAVMNGSVFAKGFAPRRRRNRIAAAIDWRLRGRGVGEFGILQADEKTETIAASQESGSVPHEIGAEGQKLYNKEEEFSARGPVMHPGTSAQHYIARAAEMVNANLHSYVEDELGRRL